MYQFPNTINSGYGVLLRYFVFVQHILFHPKCCLHIAVEGILTVENFLFGDRLLDWEILLGQQYHLIVNVD